MKKLITIIIMFFSIISWTGCSKQEVQVQEETPIVENQPQEEEIKEETPVVEEKKTTTITKNNNKTNTTKQKKQTKKTEVKVAAQSTFTGYLTHYGPDCKGCGGTTAAGYNVKNTIGMFSKN